MNSWSETGDLVFGWLMVQPKFGEEFVTTRADGRCDLTRG